MLEDCTYVQFGTSLLHIRLPRGCDLERPFCTSAFLGMCLRKVAQDQEIPFELKADSKFWINEARVSKAAALLKNGTFFAVRSLKDEVDAGLEKRIYDLAFSGESENPLSMLSLAIAFQSSARRTSKRRRRRSTRKPTPCSQFTRASPNNCSCDSSDRNPS